MARILASVLKGFVKSAIQVMPDHPGVIRLLPNRLAFQKVWPMIDKIPGFLVSPRQEQWLFEAARSLGDGAIILEIGSYKGRSTACLALGCTRTKKHVFTIDTFDGNKVDFHERDFYAEFWQNIERCGLKSYVTPIIGSSAEIAYSWREPIDLLFIDGSHQLADVLDDFHNFFPHVVPGGIVALHDVVEDWPGPLRAWNEHIRHRLVNIDRCETLFYGRKSPSSKAILKPSILGARWC